ncbi:uncharacterized protein LOC100903566 [Galendromus occidentalis]|uniref:Uncharacterized protein LOC100903566 n=1 Tax=Galendromus occidentalis TaxID=34638 RepID=A0AAJ7L6T6_9ACAR|nr:uncharacterized protein LOC100903566 [Galendromus occidentalis]
MLCKKLLVASLLVAVSASSGSSNEFCGPIELLAGPAVNVVGTWDVRVYTDGIVECSPKDQRCKYKTSPNDEGIELVVESLVWSRSESDPCDRIVQGKFVLSSTTARGQIAVIIAIGLAGFAVLTVFLGCLAYYSHPDAFWGRILKRRRRSNQAAEPRQELPTMSESGFTSVALPAGATS